MKLATLTILLTLLGLLSVQAYLLWVSIEAEREWFDDLVDKTLLDIHHNVEDDKQLSGTLIYILQSREAGRTPSPDSIRLSVAEMTLRIDSISQMNGIHLDFDFVLYDTENYASQFYPDGEEPVGGAYTSNSIKAGWRIRNALGEGRYRFGLKYDNIYLFLLKRLGFMFGLSMLLFLLLGGAVMFVIRNWRRERTLTLLRNDLVNNLTHELNTPLFSSSLLLKLLRKNLNGHTQGKELLEMLDMENRKLRDRVEKVLDVARIEDGRLVLENDPVDMHAIIRQAVRPFRFRLNETPGSITVACDARLSQVKGDAIHLENVICNLMENAVKYSTEGPHITLRTRNEGRRLVISISDNGPGIPEQERELVFEKFYRVETPELQSGRGIGLGLSYVRMIMQLHAGEIVITGNSDAGTTIVLNMPVL